MKLYLVRHGETAQNKQRILQGKMNTPLSTAGQMQARKIAHRLKNHAFDAIYSSDLDRAHSTCKEIAKHHTVDIILDARLQERDFGEFEGKSVEAADHSELFSSNLDAKTGGAESINEMSNRVNEFSKQIAGKEVLIVSHGQIIACILVVLLNKTHQEIWEMGHTKNTALFVLEKKGNAYELITHNCTAHLLD